MNMTTTTPKMKDTSLSERVARDQLRQLYAMPAEWLVDDDSPRHIGAGLLWTDTTHRH